jgi:hypothetical protein
MSIKGGRASQLHRVIHEAVYEPRFEELWDSDQQSALVAATRELAARAFVDGDRESQRAAHRVLYVLFIAQLATPWERPAVQISHPLFANLRFILDGQWEAAERKRHADTLAWPPHPDQFEAWAHELVRAHRSNVTHPLFKFLRDDATLTQVREFFFQETPLEVLFGDIIGLMMPGTYGEPKCELAKNFWDEVGHADQSRIHRNMRMDMMRTFQIPTDANLRCYEHLVVEELELINTYLSMATNRGKLAQLVGVMFATENMIPGRFEHQIEGMRRLGVLDSQMSYMLEHTTVDVGHANDWLEHVVKPLLAEHPHVVGELAFGVLRRLDAAGRVCDRMLTHLADFKAGRSLSFEHAASA